jgi:hypothetical protein
VIHRHMAGDATVEESALLLNRLTGEPREVDVVVSSDVAGHPVVVSVEATSGERPADVEWVERMVGKHRNLPTSKLVLVSEGGFTAQARELADREEAIALAPVDLEGGSPAARIVGRLKTLWPKLLSLTPERFRIVLERPDGSTGWFRGEPDHLLFLQDGSPVATLNGYAHLIIRKRFAEIAEQLGLAEISSDIDTAFVLESTPAGVTGEARSSLYVRWEESDPPELHPVAKLIVGGRAHIEVRELPLRHMRLGQVEFARGEMELGGSRSLVVVTEDDSGGKLTMRPLPMRKSGRAPRRRRRSR